MEIKINITIDKDGLTIINNKIIKIHVIQGKIIKNIHNLSMLNKIADHKCNNIRDLVA